MDLEVVILSEASQTKTNIILYHMYVESKRMIHINLFTKQKESHRHRKKIMVTKEGVGRYKLRDWNFHIHTTIYKIEK